MTRTKIAIDLDDVLFDFIGYFFEWHNHKFGTAFKPNDMVYDFLWEVWDGTKEDAGERVELFFKEIDMLSMGPIAGAYEVLTRLKEKYDLYIVSARPKSTYQDTAAWLDKYFTGIFQEVELGIGNPLADGRILSKAELCRQKGIETLVDDQLVHALACSKLGIETLLFGNHGWNQTNNLPPGTSRVQDWFEIGRILLA